jgi:hypothetical protein
VRELQARRDSPVLGAMLFQRHVILATAFVTRPFMPRWVVRGEMDPRAWLLSMNEFEDEDTLDVLLDITSGGPSA